MTQAVAALGAASTPARDDQPGGDQAVASTRDRILDVALDLFTDQGFDGTSMREIAERLHLSKPAIYYHFASKEEILMALHMRLHEFGKAALARLSGQTVTLQIWGSLLNELLDSSVGPAQDLPDARAQPGRPGETAPQGPRRRARRYPAEVPAGLADPSLSLRNRVRMACSLGAVFGGLLMAGDAFGNVSNAELGSQVRDAVRDLLADPDA